jgi:hypothetical protein
MRREALRAWLWAVLANEQALKQDTVRRFLILPTAARSISDVYSEVNIVLNAR